MAGVRVNIENHGGGHGSVGGAQLHPFVLARKALSVDASLVTSAAGLHPLLGSRRPEPAAVPT
jgi:hypothetical protein